MNKHLVILFLLILFNKSGFAQKISEYNSIKIQSIIESEFPTTKCIFYSIYENSLIIIVNKTGYFYDIRKKAISDTIKDDEVIKDFLKEKHPSSESLLQRGFSDSTSYYNGLGQITYCFIRGKEKCEFLNIDLARYWSDLQYGKFFQRLYSLHAFFIVRNQSIQQ